MTPSSLPTVRVSSMPARSKASVSAGWTEASEVAMKRVPKLAAPAPRARAAARPAPSAKPPEAMIGTIGPDGLRNGAQQHQRGDHLRRGVAAGFGAARALRSPKEAVTAGGTNSAAATF